MLLSLSHKFIFVANLKSASSSIEQALGPYAEFRVTKTQFGKHDGLSTISKKFRWVERYVPADKFFVFGVMRDPIDFILSLYNFHTLSGFEGKRHSSRGRTFDQFWDDWCGRSWQVQPQHRRFQDRFGLFKPTHIIDFGELDEEFGRICDHLGIEATLRRTNISPTVLSRGDLTPEQISRIEARFSDDYALLKTRPRL